MNCACHSGTAKQLSQQLQMSNLLLIAAYCYQCFNFILDAKLSNIGHFENF